MSETIHYYGEIMGWKNNQEKKEIELLISGSDLLEEAEVHTTSKPNQQVWFDLPDGWRGGGATCEELIKDVFCQFCKMHPHIEVSVTASYVEHSPYDEITIKGEDIKVREGLGN